MNLHRSARLPCQGCGRLLVPLKDGTARYHNRSRGCWCPSSGFRLERWPVGQRLRHHGGSVWEVVEDRGGQWGDYFICCVVGTEREGWLGGEVEGRMQVAHGEYLHRDGWRPIA